MLILDEVEADFLAHYIDAQLIEIRRMKANLTDYMTAQLFLNRDMNPKNLPDSVVLDQIEEVENGLQVIRQRINEVYES